MDTQNTELKTQNTDPVLDTSNDQIKIQEEEKQEEPKVEEEEPKVEEKEPKEESKQWKEKFEKQSSSAQRILTQTNEKLFNAHYKLSESNPSHLAELARGDDKDVKLAKQISKKLYDLSLEQVLESLKPEEESKEDLEKRLRLEIERDSNRKATYNLYIKNNSILDENSSEYNENVRKSFDERVDRLMGNDIMTIEETSEILEDAFYLSTRGGKDPDKTQSKIATAGSGGGVSNIRPSQTKEIREIDEALIEAGFSPLSEEAKKYIKEKKI